MPSEFSLENEQNDYQEIDESAQTKIQPQVVVTVYDHVNLNSTHEVSIDSLFHVTSFTSRYMRHSFLQKQLNSSTSDEAGYNVTQHLFQQTSTDYGRDGQTYAKLQNDEVL